MRRTSRFKSREMAKIVRTTEFAKERTDSPVIILKMPAGNDIWLDRLCGSKPRNWNLLLYKISCSSSYRWFTDLTSSDPCCWLLKLTYIRRACPNLLKKSPKLCLPKQPTNAHNHQKVSLSQCPSPYPPCIIFLTTLPTNAANVHTTFPLTNF